MKNSKLILLLGTFTPIEWRRFGDFLASPFFNKKTELLPFYTYLRSIAPDFLPKYLDKELLFKKFYPNQPFSNRALVHLNNYLLKQAEHFLASLRLEQEEHTINTFILEELMERKLDKHYKHYINRAKEILSHKKHTSSNLYFHEYQLSDIAKRYFLGQKQRKYDQNLQDSLDNLDRFYFFNKLKSSCEMLVWKNILSADFSFSFTKEVVEHLENKSLVKDSITEIYLHVYYLLTKENAEKDFIQLRKLLIDNREVIPIIEKNYIYTFAINFCGRQMKLNNNAFHYAAQCLELYLEGINQKFLYVNGFLSPWTFKNIVKLGFNLKKFDWTAEFIQTYSTHLEKDFQEDALHYNMADLNYRKQDYGVAQNHLMLVKYSDMVYNLGAKTMLIKIYFETDEEEALLSMIASFTIFLKRNKKISNNIRQTYLNFTSLLYQLLKAKPHKLLGIREKIRTTELLTDRRWLLKASEITQKIFK